MVDVKKLLTEDERMRDYNWNFDDPVSAYTNFYVMLFYCLADEAYERCGEKGKEAVADGMTRYGNFRGALLRTRHVRQGHPINVYSYETFYDLPRDVRTTAKEFMLSETGYYTEFYTCPFSDIWKMMEGVPFDQTTVVGRMYCDYFHPAMWEGYCKGMRLELPKIISATDDYCIFYTALDSQADLDPTHGLVGQWDTVDWNIDNPTSAMSNIYVMMFYFLADAFLRDLGDEGEDIVAKGLTKYAHLRGGMLAKRHKEMGLEINVKNFHEHYDLPGDPRTENETVSCGENSSRLLTHACHMEKIWKALEGVGPDQPTKIGSLYCRYFHPAMWEGYCADMHLDLPKAFTYGDDICEFNTTLQ